MKACNIFFYPKDVYELRELLFGSLGAFKVHFKEEQKVFQNFGGFDFWVILCQKWKLIQGDRDNEMYVEACIDISTFFVNFDPRTYFFCKTDPQHFVSSFITTLEVMPTQSKTQLKMKVIEVETAIEIKLCAIQNNWTNYTNEQKGW